MTTRKTPLIVRSVATSVAAALLVTAPGLPFYRAAAQTIPGLSNAGTAVGGVGAGANGVNGGFSNGSDLGGGLQGPGLSIDGSITQGLPAGGAASGASAAVQAQGASAAQGAPVVQGEGAAPVQGAQPAVSAYGVPSGAGSTAAAEGKDGRKSVVAAAAQGVSRSIEQLKRFFGRKASIEEPAGTVVPQPEDSKPSIQVDLTGRDADYLAGYRMAKDWTSGSAEPVALPQLRPWAAKLGSQQAKLQARRESFYKGMAHAIAERSGDEMRVPEFFKALGRGELPHAILNRFFPSVPTEGIPVPPVEAVSAPEPGKGENGGGSQAPPEEFKLPRSLKGLVFGHHILIILGLNLHVYSQAGLVENLTGSRAMVGVIRNVHFGSYTMAGFLPIGQTIKQTDFKTLFIGTSVMRGLLMGLIPVIAWTMSPATAIVALAVVVAMNPMFQNMMTTSDAAATDTFLGDDEKVNKRAAAKLTQIDAVANIAIPLIAGYVVSLLTGGYGELMGYALAYLGYAVMLFVAIPVFHMMVKDPRLEDADVSKRPATGLRSYLNIFIPAWEALKGVSMVLGTTEAFRIMGAHYAGFKARHGTAAALGYLALITAFSLVWVPVLVARVWLGRVVAAVRKLIGLIKRGGHTPGSMAKAVAVGALDLLGVWPAIEIARDGIVRIGRGRAIVTGIVTGVAVVSSPAWLPLLTLGVWAGRIAYVVKSVWSLDKGLADSHVAKAADAPPTRREKLARFFEKYPSLVGLSVILRSDTLSILVTVAGIEMFLADAMTFIVLQNYIADVVHPRLDLAHIPVVGTLLSTKAGILTLMFMAMNVARLIASTWIDGDKGDKRLEKKGHPFFYKVAALGSVAFVAMLVPLLYMPDQSVQDLIHQGYKLMSSKETMEQGKALILQGLQQIPLWQFWTTLGVFLGTQFVSALAHTPLLVAIRAVKRKQIPNDQIGPVNQAFQMVDVALMAVGALTLGVVMDMLSVQTGLLVATAAVLGTSVMTWLGQKWLNKVNPEGWKRGEDASEAPKGPKGPSTGAYSTRRESGVAVGVLAAVLDAGLIAGMYYLGLPVGFVAVMGAILAAVSVYAWRELFSGPKESSTGAYSSRRENGVAVGVLAALLDIGLVAGMVALNLPTGFIVIMAGILVFASIYGWRELFSDAD